MKKYLIIFFFSFLSLYSLANHIVGGEIFYDYIGQDRYKITLKVYRDCNVNVNFDGTGGDTYPAAITVYDASNILIGVFNVGAPTISSVPAAFSSPCIQPPTGTCIEEGVYIDTLTLPPIAGGYTIVYQRCCRNAGVANLGNSSLVGSSYFTKIPGPEDAVNNSSPRFTALPPIYICNNVRFKFDHSAIDPDGDHLVYSLCAPYIGLDGCCPSLGITSAPVSGPGCVSPPFSCPAAAPPPPYTNVTFAPPFSGSYPIASNPAFSIDSLTGQFAGTPTLIALYVVGVCVKEYRNGKLINTHFRDVQFTVVNCTVTTLSAAADQPSQCEGQTISFHNQSINNSANPVYHWDFGVPNLATDTTSLFNPTYTYQDTGLYTITLICNPGRTCSDTLQKLVSVYPPLSISYDRVTRQCFKNNSFNFTATGIYIQQTIYTWDFTSHASPSVSVLKDPVNIHFLESGLFFVKLKAKQLPVKTLLSIR